MFIELALPGLKNSGTQREYRVETMQAKNKKKSKCNLLIELHFTQLSSQCLCK